MYGKKRGSAGGREGKGISGAASAELRVQIDPQGGADSSAAKGNIVAEVTDRAVIVDTDGIVPNITG